MALQIDFKNLDSRTHYKQAFGQIYISIELLTIFMYRIITYVLCIRTTEFDFEFAEWLQWKPQYVNKKNNQTFFLAQQSSK